MKKTSASSAARLMRSKTVTRCYWCHQSREDVRLVSPPRAFCEMSLRSGMKHANRHETRDNGCERGPNRKQYPAGALPDFAEPRGLDENIYQVGGTIRDVCRYGQQK